jgi:hypothetical protein
MPRPCIGCSRLYSEHNLARVSDWRQGCNPRMCAGCLLLEIDAGIPNPKRWLQVYALLVMRGQTALVSDPPPGDFVARERSLRALCTPHQQDAIARLAAGHNPAA